MSMSNNNNPHYNSLTPNNNNQHYNSLTPNHNNHNFDTYNGFLKVKKKNFYYNDILLTNYIESYNKLINIKKINCYLIKYNQDNIKFNNLNDLLKIMNYKDYLIIIDKNYSNYCGLYALHPHILISKTTINNKTYKKILKDKLKNYWYWYNNIKKKNILYFIKKINININTISNYGSNFSYISFYAICKHCHLCYINDGYALINNICILCFLIIYYKIEIIENINCNAFNLINNNINSFNLTNDNNNMIYLSNTILIFYNILDKIFLNLSSYIDIMHNKHICLMLNNNKLSFDRIKISQIKHEFQNILTIRQKWFQKTYLCNINILKEFVIYKICINHNILYSLIKYNEIIMGLYYSYFTYIEINQSILSLINIIIKKNNIKICKFDKNTIKQFEKCFIIKFSQNKNKYCKLFINYRLTNINKKLYNKLYNKLHKKYLKKNKIKKYIKKKYQISPNTLRIKSCFKLKKINLTMDYLISHFPSINCYVQFMIKELSNQKYVSIQHNFQISKFKSHIDWKGYDDEILIQQNYYDKEISFGTSGNGKIIAKNFYINCLKFQIYKLSGLSRTKYHHGINNFVQGNLSSIWRNIISIFGQLLEYLPFIIDY